MENRTETKSGIGFTGLLTIAFIVLKLCGVINWAWVWVLSPLWISLGLFVLIFVSVLIVALAKRNCYIKKGWE